VLATPPVHDDGISLAIHREDSWQHEKHEETHRVANGHRLNSAEPLNYRCVAHT